MLSNEQIELRKKLMRRLIWKAPLIIALVTFAAWWRSRQEVKNDSLAKSVVVSAQMTQKLTGSWQGEVNYPGRGKHAERFMFQPEGETLLGTASYLGLKHGMEEGRINGAAVSLFIRYVEVAENVNREHKTYPWGKLADSQVHMRVQDDRGTQPIEFSLKKNTAGEQSH